MNNLPDIDVTKNIVIKSNEKFIVSKDLHKLKHYDDSVSRAYYSVFHILCAVLFTKGFTFSSHKETIGNFNREFIKTKILSDIKFKKIEKLYENRQSGDYEIKKYIDEETSLLSIQDAEEIIIICKKYLSELYKVKIEYWDNNSI